MSIIEMANDSGLVYYGMGKDRARFIHHLENFAHLVAAAARADERERIEKAWDKLYGWWESDDETKTRGTT